MLDTLLPILCLSALLLAAIGAVRRVRLWRQGRPSPAPIIRGLMQVPRRYLVDLHHVVERDKPHLPYPRGHRGRLCAGRHHWQLWYMALGLIALFLAWVLLAATVSMFLGSLVVAKRRSPPPSRLSKGPWMRLPKSLMAFSIGMFVVTLPTAGILPEELFPKQDQAGLCTGPGRCITWGLGEMFFGMAPGAGR